MKKWFLILMILALPLTGTAQKKDKIKGNREVLTRVYTVAPFRYLEAGDNLRIVLKKASDTTQIQLKADENLHEVLKWEVTDGKLKIWLSKKIVSKKKFELTVFVPKDFEGLFLYDYARAETDEKLVFEKFYLEQHERSESNLALKIKDFIGIKLMDNSRAEQDLECKKLLVNAKQSGTLRGTLFADEAKIHLENSGKVKTSGRIKNLTLDLSGHAEYKGFKTHITQKAQVSITNKGQALVNGKKAGKILMHLVDSGILYIKGNFDTYKIETFKDNAAIFHRD